MNAAEKWLASGLQICLVSLTSASQAANCSQGMECSSTKMLSNLVSTVVVSPTIKGVQVTLVLPHPNMHWDGQYTSLIATLVTIASCEVSANARPLIVAKVATESSDLEWQTSHVLRAWHPGVDSQTVGQRA